MRLKDEKYVCALANYGTIREASEKLYISAPALSMYINHLEKELGVDLFYRNQQRFFPTDIGKKYLERCQKILEIDQEFSIQLGQKRKLYIYRYVQAIGRLSMDSATRITQSEFS